MRQLFAPSALLILTICGSPTASRADACLDLTSHESKVTLSGSLTTQLFAGPPNYESIANGDAEENAFILELTTHQCADDGGTFIDSSKTFDRVQLSSLEPALIKVLSAAVGRDVTVQGEAFGAHTGHHHAPLVLFVGEITVR